MQKRIATGSYSADQILPTAQFDDAAPDVPKRRFGSAFHAHPETRSLAVVTFRCILTVVMTLAIASIISMRSPADLLLGGQFGQVQTPGSDIQAEAYQHLTEVDDATVAQVSGAAADVINVAFIYSPGLYRKGLVVSLRSACLTDRHPESLALHVLALPDDAEGALQLNREWRAWGLPCSLSVFVFKNRRFTWGKDVLPKVREHYRNEYNFVQHIDLPAQLGRRGVDFAMVLDTDIVFHGHDAARIAVTNCAPLLMAKPAGIACCSQTKNGFGMGALVLNTSRYAANDIDMEIYKYALAAGKIQGTKPLMNKFFKLHTEYALIPMESIQKNHNIPPCDEGIAHFAAGIKPWLAGRGQLPCVRPRADNSCSRWSYCRWQYYLYTEPADLIKGEQ